MSLTSRTTLPRPRAAPRPCRGGAGGGPVGAGAGGFSRLVELCADDGSGTICFAMTKPKSSGAPREVSGEAYVYVTDRPAEDVAACSTSWRATLSRRARSPGCRSAGRTLPSSPRAMRPGSTSRRSRRRWRPPSAAARPLTISGTSATGTTVTSPIRFRAPPPPTGRRRGVLRHPSERRIKAMCDGRRFAKGAAPC